MSAPMPVPEPAKTRVIRITNVHFKATNDEIKNLFPDFKIESVFRTINVKTGRRSVAYILFSTITEKNRACALAGLWIRDREVEVQPAPNGNYQLNDDGTAFINIKKASVATAEVADESPTIDDANFPALGTPRAPQGQKSPKEPVGTSKAKPSTADTKNKTDIETETAEIYTEFAAGTSTLSLERTQAKEIVGLATPGNETSPALAVECDTESPCQTLLEEKSYPVFKTGDQIPPPNTFDNFNLAGDNPNDPSKSFPTGSAWYGFQADQFAKVEQKHRDEGTNAARIANYKIEENEQADEGAEQ